MKTGIISVVLCGVSHMNVVDSAGMTSHNVAARRASQFEYFGPKTSDFDPDSFYGLAETRSDAIQGGSPFPDYLYACGDEHDAGEEAHWTPFQIESVNYIRDKYPNWATDGRDSDGAGLVAFTLGVTSHYITDINWHGLEVIPSGEGLIRTMGYSDFNCTNGDLCDVAHHAADTGGEFAAAASLDLKWYPQDDWFMPTDDLVNIYANMNALGEGPLVEPQWINECAILFYAGSFGVSRFGDLIYPLMAPTLGGLLLEEYFDFPVGGVDDDAAWTGFMWNRLAEWLVYGPPPPDPPPNKDAPSGYKRLREVSLQAKKAWVRSVRSQLLQSFDHFKDASKKNSGESDVVIEGGLFGAYKTRKSDGSASVSGTFVGIARHDEPSSKDSKQLLEKQLADDLEILGNSLIDNYLLVLFPHMLEEHSSSQVLSVRRNLRDRAELLARQMTEPSSTPLTETRQRVMGSGTAPHEYFGSSLSVSSSGDVLVGAPGAGRTGGPQEGAAHLFLSKALGEDKKVSLRGSAVSASVGDSITLRGGQGGGLTDAFPSYERFGWAAVACDVTGDGVEDWVVCAPSFGGGRDTDAARGNYTGRCDIFFGPFSLKHSQPVPDASIYGDKEWGNFGYAVTAGDVDNDGYADLIISAPYVGSYADVAPNDRGDLSSQGAVFVYLAKTFSETFNSPNDKVRFSLRASSSADLVMQRPESFQWFGKSLAVAQVSSSSNGPARPLLVVGAPAFHSDQDGSENSAVGKIFVYDLALSHTEHVAGIYGCGHAGRTGHAVIASPTHLVFSEPHFNASSTTAQGPEELSLHRGRGKMDGLRAGRVVAVSWSALLSSSSSEVRVCELKSALGPDAVVDSVGEGFESRYGTTLAFTEDATVVLVGAPLADDTNGRVYSLNLASGAAEVVLSGRERAKSKGRTGQAIVVTKGAVYVGAPYLSVSDVGEQEGEVFVL